MADREKVIKWLDVCKTADRAVGLKEDYPCRECPYKGSPRCMRELVSDALALLKEQEDDIRNLTADLEEVRKEHQQLLDKKIPLITDGQEVVRCKNCKWGKPAKNCYGEDRIICENDDTYIDRYITVPTDWYCADGEPKDEPTSPCGPDYCDLNLDGDGQ